MAETKGIKLSDYERNRCVGWQTTAKDPRGKGVYSADLIGEDGAVNAAMCQTLGIDPATVKPIKVEDLPAEYAQGSSEALAKLASEWEMSADDVVWHLVLNARLQDAANESVKLHRPVSDVAKTRAYTTMVAALAAQHGISKPEAEKRFADVLSALK